MNRRKFFGLLPAAALAPVATATAATKRDRMAYRATATVDGYGTMTLTDDYGRKRMVLGPAGITVFDENEKPAVRCLT